MKRCGFLALPCRLVRASAIPALATRQNARHADGAGAPGETTTLMLPSRFLTFAIFAPGRSQGRNLRHSQRVTTRFIVRFAFATVPVDVISAS